MSPDDLLKRVEKLGELARLAAKDCAIAVKQVGKSQLSQGTSLDGSKIEARKDGRPALVHAAESFDCIAVGNSIILTIRGIEARHSRGAVKGGKKRPLLPGKTVPEPIAKAAKAQLDIHFRRITGGQE